MISFPSPIQDTFEAVGSVVESTAGFLDPITRGIPGFNDLSPLPSSSGNGTRFKNIPNRRLAVFTRNIMKWFVPEVGIIEMYINPQNISYNYKKDVKEIRTRGGYVYQYWGEEPMTLNINGTTGSSGIEGINVLEDIYRSEQVAFDPYALALAAQRDAEAQDQFSFLGDFPDGSLGSLLSSTGSSFVDLVQNSFETGNAVNTRSAPTLADLAFSVEMYWSGCAYRGYFMDFKVDESATKLGLFDYNMTFRVTQKRGLRTNFLGWHRSAINGPSNTDPEFGTPYSYSGLSSTRNAPVPAQNESSGPNLGDLLESGVSLLGDAADSITSIF